MLICNLKGFAPMSPAPYSLEKRLPSGEVAKCIGELATQEAPGGTRRLRRLPGGSGGSKIAFWVALWFRGVVVGGYDFWAGGSGGSGVVVRRFENS